MRVTPLLNYLVDMGRSIWLNQNCAFDGEIDTNGKETRQISYAMEDHPLNDAIGDSNIGYWSEENIESGREAKNYTDLSMVLGIAGHYLDFLGGSVTGYIAKGFKAASSYFLGKRDERQYDVIGRGANFNLPDDVISNPEESMKSHLFGDDFIENDLQRVKYGESLTAKLGKIATDTSVIKPIAYFMSEFLGDGIASAVRTIVDYPATLWWRIRMFASSLHANFATTVICTLPSLWIKSMFGSKGAKDKLNERLEELHSSSKKYFDMKYKDSSKVENSSRFGLYIQMLMDRMKSHWKGILNPQEALEEKIKSGAYTLTNEEERNAQPHKNIVRGFIDPNSESDQSEQRRASLTDFTGALSAAFGTLTMLTITPIKTLMLLFGVQKGLNFVNVIDTLRKVTHLGNYIWRFILVEMNASKDYKKLLDVVKPKNGNTESSDIVSEYYNAAKSRYSNAIFNGFGTCALTTLEMFTHMFRSRLPEATSPLVDALSRINASLILKFFSSRRQHLGRMTFIESLVKSKLEGQGKEAKDFIQALQTTNISKEEMQRILLEIKDRIHNRDVQENRVRTKPLENIFSAVSSWWDSVREKFEDVGVRAQAA